MPASPLGVYVVSSIAIVGAGVAFKRYVYDPHIKPMFEDMLATFLHHSHCLNDPIGVTVDPVEEEQLERFRRRHPAPSTPWHRYHPSRKIDTNENSDNELEREMEFLGIPDVDHDQFASPDSISAGIKGLDPVEEYYENEARRSGAPGSALGIDLSGSSGTKDSQISATTTAIDPFFGHEYGGGAHHLVGITDEGILRRRHPERVLAGNIEPSSPMGSASASQYTIVPVSISSNMAVDSTEVKPTTPVCMVAEPALVADEPCEIETALSSPDLTESSLIDITSYAPSAFSVSSASDVGYDQTSTHLSGVPTRAHSPAFSASSYDVLSPPAGIASMPTSPHAMNASIFLENLPPFDEYNVHNARYHAPSQASSNAQSENGWTDGDLESDNAW